MLRFDHAESARPGKKVHEAWKLVILQVAMDQTVQLWQWLLGLVVTVSLAVIGSWVTIRVALAKVQQRQDSLDKQQTTTDERVTRANERMTRIDAKLDRTVTDEEFQALAGQTVENVNRLTEKVGRFAGLVEGWSRSERR